MCVHWYMLVYSVVGVGTSHYYFINIRSDRKTYLVPFVTGEPSCNIQS